MNTHESYTVPGTGMRWGYLKALPADYNENDEQYPLVVFLHGIGECGDGDSELDLVASHGYAMHAAQGVEYPFILISPQLPKGKVWWAHIESLNLFLDHLIETLRVDAKRIYLTGLSLGGMGTWMWGATNPERFAALLPVCGEGLMWAGRQLLKTPVWAFHGDHDQTVDCSGSERMVNSINAMGGHARLTLYPDVGHNCWVYAYDDPTVINWMLEQHLQ